MAKIALKTALQALLILGASAALAVGTNAVRPDGIDLVTDVEYEIFAACKDSEAEAEAADVSRLQDQVEDSVLYVDARPAEAFTAEHVSGAINVPYSALFGASAEDLAAVRQAAGQQASKIVVVYGLYHDRAAPAEAIDFAKPLAQQLVESGLTGAKHVAGGLEELKKNGIQTVQANGDTK